VQVATGKAEIFFKKNALDQLSAGGGGGCWTMHKNKVIATFVETSENPHICMLPNPENRSNALNVSRESLMNTIAEYSC